MADSPRPDSQSEPPSESYDLGEAGGSLALRAEMGIQEFLLTWWKALAAAIAAVVIGFVLFGWYESMKVADARSTAAAIASVEAELPSGLLELAQSRAGMGEAAEPEVLLPAAAALRAIGTEESGAGSVEALLKAAELYRMAQAPKERREVLELASAKATGVLAFAATGALANLDLEDGKVDEGLARLESLTSLSPEFLARQATLDLGAAQEAVGRDDAARATYDRFLQTWPNSPEAEEARDRRDQVGQGIDLASQAPKQDDAERAPAAPDASPEEEAASPEEPAGSEEG